MLALVLGALMCIGGDGDSPASGIGCLMVIFAIVVIVIYLLM
jgi:hypothetical protein